MPITTFPSRTVARQARVAAIRNENAAKLSAHAELIGNAGQAAFYSWILLSLAALGITSIAIVVTSL